MEYHEIGEKFEYKGVMLEAAKITDLAFVCKDCYFSDKNDGCMNFLCQDNERDDEKDVIYKLVEQCKTKDMEQKTEFDRIKDEFIIEGTDKTFATQVTNIQSDEEIYGSLLDKLFATYKAKNKDYGSAFSEMFNELGIDYAYGKLREKINRIKVLRKQPNMVENEGLEDALLDTAGYAILTLVELKKRKQ